MWTGCSIDKLRESSLNWWLTDVCTEQSSSEKHGCARQSVKGSGKRCPRRCRAAGGIPIPRGPSGEMTHVICALAPPAADFLDHPSPVDTSTDIQTPDVSPRPVCICPSLFAISPGVGWFACLSCYSNSLSTFLFPQWPLKLSPSHQQPHRRNPLAVLHLDVPMGMVVSDAIS
ncbi:hypothetical protein BS50DRAFT_147412 [Corynespora cassiicola Philippines]|uniref:Uncharacterized protein n=1 Tax=Corynespora cassiicola Philippines TaxID=1448308 RepID=A0A2T2N8T9_CORCC|nr:hypothetical protein BS50DRAFT_147412 [Corynespora cassiicola Philippines]